MRDLTKVLSDADELKLRALLRATPDVVPGTPVDQEYPKMLFHRNFIELHRLIKNHTDVLVKKEAQEKMRHVVIIVHDIETEEDYLADGWRNDPNDFITMSVDEGGLGEPDPRIPTGREGRRAATQNRASREQELRDLRRRYAELTGKRFADEDDPVPQAATPAPAARPVPATTSHAPVLTGKRAKVAAAAARAAAPKGRSQPHV